MEISTMGLSNSISRIAEYSRRHGLTATIKRAGLAAKRELFSGRMVVFYCDLADLHPKTDTIPDPVRIDRITSESELGSKDREAMTGFWNPLLANRKIRERFEKGASLWLIRLEGNLAGYGWTLKGRTIEPYFFPLGRNDVHLFDFHVFPQHRGRGINPRLVTHILYKLATTGGGRAFIEAAEWNQPQLSSLRKTPFRRLGSARPFAIFGHRVTHWIENDTNTAMEHVHGAGRRKERARAVAKLHQQ